MRGAAVLTIVLGLWLASTVMATDDPLDPAGAPAAVRRAVFRAESARVDGDYEKAVRLLTEALTEALAEGNDRDHPALRYRLGAFLLELGRPDEAVGHLARATELAPESHTVWRDHARAAYETGNYAAAARSFLRAYDTQADPDPVLLYYGGVSWLMADNPSDALDVLAPLVDTLPDTVPYDWVQAVVAAATAADQPDRADRAVARLLAEHPDAPDSWRLASQQAQLTDDLPTAALRLQVTDWLSPLTPHEIRRLAELYAAAGLPRLAARAYARLWPADSSVARSLAVAWRHAHEPDSTRMVLLRALDDGDDPDLWLLLGDLEYDADHWDTARRAFAAASRNADRPGRALLMEGACLVELGRLDEASVTLERAAGHDDVADQAGRLQAQVRRMVEQPMQALSQPTIGASRE